MPPVTDIRPSCIPDGAEMKAVKQGFRSKCINCRTNAITVSGDWLHERNMEFYCYPESE